MNKVLVIGSGSIAQRHINNLHKLNPAMTVVCKSASGRKLLKGEVACQITNAPLSAIDLSEFDLAIVASPSTSHVLHAESLNKKKIPTLIEKPLCASLSELRSCSLNNTDTKIGVGYNLRFMPSALVVKELLKNGVLGRISTVRAEVGQYLPDWRPNSDYRNGVTAQRKLGGGALLELSHELDYLNWMFGDFQRVIGTLRTSKFLDIDVEDSVDALLIDRSNVLFHVHLDLLQRAPHRSLKVIGENGTLDWNLLANEVVISDGNTPPRRIYSEPDYEVNKTYLEQLKAFMSYVQGASQFESNVRSATEVMQLVEAIRLSDKNKCWIRLEDVV